MLSLNLWKTLEPQLENQRHAILPKKSQSGSMLLLSNHSHNSTKLNIFGQDTDSLSIAISTSTHQPRQPCKLIFIIQINSTM